MEHLILRDLLWSNMKDYLNHIKKYYFKNAESFDADWIFEHSF